MLFSCRGIKKSYGVDTILEDVTFQIENKEKIAVVGTNGAGKSTLFKIIIGEITKDEGEIYMPKEITLGYLSQSLEINTEKTIYDEMLIVFEKIINLEEEMRELEIQMGNKKDEELTRLMEKYAKISHAFEEKKGYEYQSRIKGVLKGLGFSEQDFSQPIYQLSGGQKTRIGLAKLLLTEPDLLLLDEPTNHLDIPSVEWLEDFLRNYGQAVIIISHDRYFLDRVVNKTIEIENKKAITYQGNYTTFTKAKEINYEIALKHYETNQKEIKHQEDVIKTLRSFNREKSIKRAESREKLLDKMDRVDKPDSPPEKMKIDLSPKKISGVDVLHVEGLQKSFDDEVLFQNVSFDIKREDKIALIGPNGIGKTTVLRILLGTQEANGGKIHFGSNVFSAYYDQEHQNIDPTKTVFQEISDAYPKMTNTEIRNLLAAFVFMGDDVFKPIAALSGGEKGRVALAKMMLSNSNFLILDEPTNHLDIFSKEILEKALKNYTGTVLFISHDRYLINSVAEKIFELTPTGANTYLGNYDYYLQKKAEAKILEAEVQEAQTSQIKEDWVKKKESQTNERKKQTRISNLEKQIAKKEAEIKAYDEQLCLPEIFSDHVQAKEVFDKKSALEEEVLTLYAEWEEIHG